MRDDKEVKQIHDNTDSLIVMIRALDEKFTMMLSEAEKRNGQRFDAQQGAVKTALEAAEKAVNAAMSAAEKAVSKAEIASERRFESVNEFRKTLSDQTQTFIPRVEYTTQYAALANKLDNVAERITQMESGHQVKAQGTGFLLTSGLVLVGAIGALAAILTVLLR